MSLISTSRRTKPADTIIATILVDLASDAPDRQARAIIKRLSRSYSHAIIDGTDFILVPSETTPPSIANAA